MANNLLGKITATKKVKNPLDLARVLAGVGQERKLVGKGDPFGPSQGLSPDEEKGLQLIAAAQQSEKLLRKSNLGTDNPNTAQPNDARARYTVGGEAVLARRKEAETFLTGLSRSAVSPGFSQMASDFLWTNNNRIKKLQNQQNSVLGVTSANRASQREAQQANAAILSGRKSRKSSVTVPRLPRAAGLLLPFDNQRLL